MIKNNLIALCLVVLSFPCFSQGFRDPYNGKPRPLVKQEKLISVKLMSEILPTYPALEYNEMLNYVFVELLTTSDGKTLTAQSTSDTLTKEQMNILIASDPGSDIIIKIKFKYKDSTNDNIGSGRKIKEMEFLGTIVPETEAEFPGGSEQMTNYLKKNILDKYSKDGNYEACPWATAMFVVDEKGDVVNSKILKTSVDPKMDTLLLNAIIKMPKWKPAKDYKGVKVKQEFKFSYPAARGC